jgi:putative hemolysin
LIQILLVLLLTLVNALFSMAEYALITVRSSRIRQLVEDGNKNAVLVEEMKDRPTRMQATLQTGLTLVTTFSSALAASSLVDPVSHWLQTSLFHQVLGTASGKLHDIAGGLALVLVAGPMAILTLVVAEIAPKSLAMRHAEKLALISVRPLRFLEVILAPVVAVLTFLSNILVRPFGGSANFSSAATDVDEYKIIVEAGKDSGVLDDVETTMIHQVLDFSDTVVRKVMTPRIDVTAASVLSPVSLMIQIITESGHSRIPVYEGDLDNIVGVVHAKDLLALATAGRSDEKVPASARRPAYFIPESKKVGDLLGEMRRGKQHMAIVRDEYGVTSGLVTIEDMLEEIVGEIQDEYDHEMPMVQVVDDQTFILDGLMGIEDVNDRLGLELSDDEADTIGGFVFNLLGHQGKQGETAEFEKARFVVETTDGRRVTKVRVMLKQSAVSEDSEEESEPRLED